MKKEKRVIYYTDESSDDFAGTNISARQIDGSYKYVRRGIIYRVCSFILYYLIALPIVWFIERAVMRVRFVNKKALRACRGKPVFLYGNHTGWYDAFTPCLISAPRRNSTVVSPDAVSIKGLRTVVAMLGGIPVPTSLRAMRNFSEAIEYHHKNTNITVYPEAHIWPFYTGVRSFPDTSFAYPVRLGSPVFAFFTAYTEPRGFLSAFRRANATVYVSDAIYPDTSLPEREARRELCERVRAFMEEKSALSTYSAIEYIKREAEDAEAAEKREADN